MPEPVNDGTDNVQPQSEPDQIQTFEESCFNLRSMIKEIKKIVWNMHHNDPEFRNEQTHEFQHSEMKANLMLSYRHLEDARMRIGKAVQAYDGGKSCYPR